LVARRGTLRASDADREQIVDRLRKASSEGRLGVRELEERVGAALRARTLRELDAMVSDLPGRPVGEPHSARRRAVGALRSHPALVLIAIPLALVAAATLVAIVVLWSTVMLLIFLLGSRRRRAWGRTTYIVWSQRGSVRGAPLRRGPFS
jgi:Domain of unknown function (DUF1707)